MVMAFVSTPACTVCVHVCIANLYDYVHAPPYVDKKISGEVPSKGKGIISEGVN